MAINNFSTTVRIGDGQNAAQITTAGGAVQVEARSNYNTKFTVMSGVDDKVVADKQSFLKRRTTSPPTSAMSDRTVPTWRGGGGGGQHRRHQDDGERGRQRQHFHQGRRRLRVGAEPEPDRPEQALAGQPVRAVRRHRGQWKAADGTSAKMGVATGAAKAFLNNLQATLSSTGGISSSFSSWVSATAKSKKLALSGLFPSTCNRPRPARPWRASSTRAAARAARPAMSTSRR